VIKLGLGEMLKKSGRSLYWLAKESGVSYNTLTRYKYGRAKGIKFDTLERICRALKCKPGDIIKISSIKE
jgi:putative transcriptional regulator